MRARAVLAFCLVLAVLTAGPARSQEPPTTADHHAEPRPLFGAGQPDPLYGDEESDPLYGDDEEFEENVGFPDPAEGTNRGVLRFNRTLDRWIFDPITRGYQFIVPAPGRRAIRRFFLNLNSPPILANDVLQLEWTDAGVTLARFVINSTVGVAGFFDVAEKIGLERHVSDFGQTLRLAGVESGPYLVVPVLGPNTVRGTTGLIMDGLFNPTTWFFGLGLGTTFVTSSPLAEQLLYTGTAGLTERDKHYESLKALEDSSVDFYSALRSAYYQNRQAEIWDRRLHREADWRWDTVPY